ncbi:MAG: hypothetical protein EOM50_13925, partial [Erysipelotrichia bacterium]|nr:hypothetical protein [Erysipelotrichia bacterium]
MQIFIELLKMPFKVFKTNKLRTLLTMFGVIVGVASVIVVTSISDATQANIQKKMDKNVKPVHRAPFQDLERNVSYVMRARKQT